MKPTDVQHVQPTVRVKHTALAIASFMFSLVGGILVFWPLLFYILPNEVFASIILTIPDTLREFLAGTFYAFNSRVIVGAFSCVVGFVFGCFALAEGTKMKFIVYLGFLFDGISYLWYCAVFLYRWASLLR